MNASFERIKNGGGAEDGIDQMSDIPVTWHENMLRLDIARTEKAVTRKEAQQSSVEHLLLGVVGRVFHVVGLRPREDLEECARFRHVPQRVGARSKLSNGSKRDSRGTGLFYGPGTSLRR